MCIVIRRSVSTLLVLALLLSPMSVAMVCPMSGQGGTDGVWSEGEFLDQEVSLFFLKPQKNSSCEALPSESGMDITNGFVDSGTVEHCSSEDAECSMNGCMGMLSINPAATFVMPTRLSMLPRFSIQSFGYVFPSPVYRPPITTS